MERKRAKRMFENYEDLLTAEEAAEALRIGKNALYALLDSGVLRGYRNGKVWRIPRKSLELYIVNQAKLPS